MTTDERFERIEHITAGIVEDRRRDRDEYKALWRENQRQLAEVTTRLAEASAGLAGLARHVDELAVETRLRIQELAEESRTADQNLGARIEALVSAIGQFMSKQ